MSIEILVQRQVRSFTTNQVTVGRGADNDVVIGHPEVSGKHLSLKLVSGKVMVEDVGSTNGTYVSGARIQGPTPVDRGVEIQLGGTGPLIEAWMKAPAQVPDLEATIVPKPPGAPSPTHQQAAPARRSSWPVWVALLALTAIVGAGYVTVMDKFENMETQANAAENTVSAGIDEFRRQLEPAMTVALGQEDAQTVFGAMTTADNVLREMRETAADPSLSEVERDERMASLRKQLRAPQDAIDAVNGKLSTRAGYSWDDILKDYGESIFLIAVYYVNAKGQAFNRGTGTAWALDGDGWLGTNAHVAEMVSRKEWPKGTRKIVKLAIQGGTGKVFDIEKIKVHKGWNGQVNSPDVALIQIDAPKGALKPLRVGTKARYEGLVSGTALGTAGFPGELTSEFVDGLEQEVLRGKTAKDLHAPGATPIFKACFVTRVTDFDRKTAPPAKSQFIGHSASTTGGTSGSPMFDKDGYVVALNNSGLQVVIASDRSINSPAALNNGIRVDLLMDLYQQVKSR